MCVCLYVKTYLYIYIYMCFHVYIYIYVYRLHIDISICIYHGQPSPGPCQTRIKISYWFHDAIVSIDGGHRLPLPWVGAMSIHLLLKRFSMLNVFQCSVHPSCSPEKLRFPFTKNAINHRHSPLLWFGFQAFLDVN